MTKRLTDTEPRRVWGAGRKRGAGGEAAGTGRWEMAAVAGAEGRPGAQSAAP